ncbi:polysulfide reductase NrfD [Mycobacterium sp. MYCO198283]|uniref:NrfD/PsrC family molybdoenzyme membrane anchor subunit n=1 Tax=Mycobacterium sp. MYCO198283 TaxID=2883505 RepID=UPI001E4E17FA|nr:NrfD/PsrC family molybdoenzyme membrane anchor subunit [Mycobacterium sp. MYCO198283]MCG5432421.1 polysulfide reductase NrfD [Mycobacterium sp. MYCO198283]
MKEQLAVPRAEFRSYYGRQILKSPVWNWMIAAYLFSGGLSAGSALLAAGADLTGRRMLARRSRIGALVSLLASMYFLIGDLGRPERFHHMLRVAKPSSPMSMGTWILGAYGPGAGLAAVAELVPARYRRTWVGRLLGVAARPAGISAAAVAPGLASYTAVLLSQTAVPAWNVAHPYLPFVFTGSAAASGGGLGMVLAPISESGPARRMAVAGAALEVGASRLMDRRLGFVGQAYTTGKPHRLRQASELLTVGGAVGAVVGGRNRWALAASGAALLSGSALQRFGVFEAGVASTKDPKYVVVPQRERIEARKTAKIAAR